MHATADAKFRELGDAMRHARETAGLTQQEAAARLGTTQGQIYRYESGKREAPLSFIRKAERVYEQIIAVESSHPSGVSRETERESGERDSVPSERHRRVLLDTANRLTSIAADLIRAANEGAAQ